MAWQFPPHLISSLVMGGIAFVLAFLAWKRRTIPGTWYLAAIAFMNGWWLLTFTLETVSRSPALMMFFTYAQYLAIASLPTFFLLFSIEFSGQSRLLRPLILVLLCAEPLVGILLAWTNDLHHLVWSQIQVITSGPYTLLETSYGVWSWFHLAYTGLVLLTSVVLMMRSLLNGRSPYRGQTLFILIGVMMFSVGVTLDLLPLPYLPGLKFTPLSITLGGIVVAVAIMRFHVLDVVPLARDIAVDNMSDGVIILDATSRIADLNLAACQIIGLDPQQAIRQPLEKVWSAWPGGMTLPLGKVEISREISLNTPEGQRFYDLRISSLVEDRGRLAGRLVVLRDITRPKRAEDALHRRDDILEAISFAAEQFLKQADWQQVILEVLSRLGKATTVHRVRLYENHLDDTGKLSSRQRFVWNVQEEMPYGGANEPSALSLLDSTFDRWLEVMSKRQAIYGPVRGFPEAEKAALQGLNIRSIVAVPIFIGKTWWGYICLEDYLSEREWTMVEVDALKVAASTIGAAIQHQQTEEEARRRAEVISTMLNLSEIIGSTLDVPQVLERVVQAARSLVILDRVVIFLWDEKTQALVSAVTSLGDGSQIPTELLGRIQKLRLSPTQVPLVRELQSKKQAIAITDVEGHPYVTPRMISALGVRSLLVAPIVFQDRFTGVLYIDYVNERHVFTNQEIELVTTLARQAGLAIERARLYTQSQQDTDELATLYRASTQLLNPGRDLVGLAEMIAQSVTHEFASAYCSVLWVDREQKALVLLAEKGFVSQRIPSLPLDGPGLTVYAANHGEVVYAPDVSGDQRYYPVSELTRSELVYPLQIGTNVIGVLNLESPELEAFDERSRRVLAAFADDATLALQNVRLFIAADTHARQLTLLNEITRTALSTSSFAEMLQNLADQMVNLIGSDECYITLWDEERQTVLPGAAAGQADLFNTNLAIVPGEERMTSQVLQTGQSLVVDDTTHSPNIGKRLAKSFKAHSALALPLISGLQKLGAVILGFDEPHVFTPREIELCEQVSGQVALALSTAWSLDVARRRAQEADNLRQAIAAITSSLDLNQVLDSIMTHLEQVVPYDSACIFLTKGDHLHAVAGRGYPDPSQVVGQEFEVDELYQEAVKLGRPMIISDAQEDPRFKGWGGTSYTRGWMGVPLRGRGTAIGWLTLDSRQVSAFDERSAALTQAFGSQAGVAIENSQLFESAQQRAREAETLRQAGAIVAGTLKQDEALQFILEQLARVVPYDSASVQLLVEGGLEIVGGLGWPEGEGSVLGLRFPLPGDNPNTVVAERRQPYILGNAPAAYPAFKPYPHIHSWMGVPLIVRERLIGMLTMDSPKPDYFTPDHARLASAFADQVAIAIENTRLYTAEQDRVRQLDALRATGADISAELEISRLLETILKRAVSLLEAAGGELGLYDPEADDLEIVASYNLGKDYTGTRMRMGEGVIGRSAETLQPLIISNYKGWQDRSLKYTDEDWQSVMASPLMVHGHLVGAISIVDTDTQRQFSANDLQLLTMFAQQAAIAVENARLYQEAKVALDRRAVLHRASQEVVTSIFDPEQIYSAIHQAAGQLMLVESFVIALLDDSEQEIDAVYLIDRGERTPPFHTPTGVGLSGMVIKSGESVYIPDHNKDDWDGVHFGTLENSRSILAVPLRAGDRVIGMLAAQSYKPNAYTTEDKLLLELLAAHAGVALENSRLVKEIQWLADTDPLLGIYNRRRLFEEGNREVERFRRFEHPFSAIMIDLDHFKQINDSFGHAVGDQVLIALTHLLQEQIRDIDVLGRYGGEEIVILLPETTLQGGVQVAERLRQQVESLPIQTDRGKLRITVSAGVAEFRLTIPDLATLLDRADSAMYLAKQSGRNLVRSYDDLLDQGKA